MSPRATALPCMTSPMSHHPPYLASLRPLLQSRWLYQADTPLFPRARSYILGGAYIQQLETGGLLTGTLDVQQTARFENNIDAFGGLNIGTPGFVSSGPVGIYSEGAGSNVLSITALE